MEIARRALAAAVVAALATAAWPGCRRRPAEPPPGQTPVGLPAAPGGALRGQVVDARDAAIPGARVLAVPAAPIAAAAALGVPPAEATTDADGRFAIERLVPGQYRLLVEAAGFASTELLAVEVSKPSGAADRAAVRVHLQGEGRAIAGRVVLAGGEPAAGAVVRLAGAGDGPTRDVISRADGGFSFGGLGDGTYAARAARGALVSATALGIAIDGRPREALRLELGPGATVAGRVVDDRGQPVQGASVRVERDEDDPLPAQARAGADGRFHAGPLPPGEHHLIARHPGYVARRPVTVRLAASADGAAAPTAPVPVTLELVRGAALVGRVADSRGAPLAGATVRCLSAGLDDLAVLSESLPPAALAAALPGGAGHALGTARTVATDGAGRFEIADLLPGRFRLEVTRTGAVPLRTPEVALAPGQRRDAGTLALAEGVPVSGRVVDAAGTPVAGARVTVAALGLYTLTSGAGTFALSLAPGRHALAVTAPGLVDREVALDVAAGAPPPATLVELARADGRLEGVVRDDGGRPLHRARVVAQGEAREGGGGGAARAALGSALTDAGGHFTIGRLPSGVTLLEVSHPRYPTTRAEAAPGSQAVVTVPIPGRIDGEVHASDGAPVPRARIAAEGPGGRTAAATTGPAGAFTLPRLAPGPWRLTATVPGHQAAAREVDVPPSAILGDASVRGLRIDLPR